MSSKIIVIPVYKNEPNRDESKSFKQGVKVLIEHQICIVTYKDLDISYYINILKKANALFSVEFFSSEYFKSISGYNQLMLSLDFYQRFSKYSYLLLYQLDAWVFEDKLNYWCQQGYDYIGAPWFEEGDLVFNNFIIIGVGNGGFSLRKVSSAIKVLKSIKRIVPYSTIWNLSVFKKLNIRGKIYSSIKLWLAIFYFRNNTSYLINNCNLNEDYFWSELVSNLFNFYKIPSGEIAMNFSFEVNPRHLFQLTKKKLPMGCHGFNIFEPDFWKEHIN